MTPGTDEQALSEQPAVAPYAAPSDVFVPESSIARPGHEGRFAHTNYVIRNTRGVHPSTKLNDALAYLRQPAPEDNPGLDSTFAEYPASLACLYKMSSTQYAGCAPTNNAAYNAAGGARAIAIVDAYHYPSAAADLSYFNSYFGLPSNFTQVIANGNGACVTPPVDTGWNLEAALDLQAGAAMAPKAKLILVEACSNSYADRCTPSRLPSSRFSERRRRSFEQLGQRRVVYRIERLGLGVPFQLDVRQADQVHLLCR